MYMLYKFKELPFSYDIVKRVRLTNVVRRIAVHRIKHGYGDDTCE